MVHDVFISYSSKQASAAQAICHTLESSGIRCWMAPRDIPAGAQYGDCIDEAIKACRVVVVLFSMTASKSLWVNGELNVAFEEQKAIIPFRLDETPLKGQLRVMLNQKHWIDAYPDYREKFQDLVRNVELILAREENDASNRVQKEHQKNEPVYMTSSSLCENNGIDDLDYEEAMTLFESTEYVEAFERLVPMALAGNRKSQEVINKIFYNVSSNNGIEYIGQFEEKHLDMIRELVAADLSCGYFALHCINYERVDSLLNPNMSDAFTYARKSAGKDNNPYALLRLGICYGWGLGTKANRKLQQLYYQKAEEAGLPDVYSYIGLFYENDTSDLNNEEKAVEYYKKGCDASDLRSFRRLTEFYTYNSNLSDAQKIDLCKPIFDDMERRELYQCYTYMGNLYTELKDINNAIKYYTTAISKGMIEAYPSLSTLYYHIGEYKKSAEIALHGLMCRDNHSAGLLAFLLINELIGKDVAKALLPTNLENIIDCPGFLDMDTHEQAWVLIKFDYEHRGNPTTICSMAQLFFDGIFSDFTTFDYIGKELSIFAEAGNAECCNLLAKVYGGEYSCLNSQVDDTKHVHYVKKAAESNDIENMLRLARYYRDGSHGIIQSTISAQELYKQVAESNDEEFSRIAIKEMNAWIENMDIYDLMLVENETEEWIMKASQKKIPEYVDKALDLLESKKQIDKAFKVAESMEHIDGLCKNTYRLRRVCYYAHKDFSGYDLDKAKGILDDLYGKVGWESMTKYWQAKRAVIPTEMILDIEAKQYQNLTDEELKVLKDYYHFIPWEYEYTNSEIDTILWGEIDDNVKKEFIDSYTDLVSAYNGFLQESPLEDASMLNDSINMDWLNEKYLERLIEIRDTTLKSYLKIKSKLHPQYSLTNTVYVNLDLSEETTNQNLRLFELQFVGIRLRLDNILSSIGHKIICKAEKETTTPRYHT